jgi:hypothetical protein
MNKDLTGTWPPGCPQRAFMDGARWMMMRLEGKSMWRSERLEAEAEAVRVYGDPMQARATAPTARQLAMMRFVHACMEDGGPQPTIREIMKEFDMQSPNGVVSHLRAIARKGLIERQWRGAIVFTPPGLRAIGRT